VWTPDSRYLTLPSDHAGTVNLVHQDADFRGAAEPLVPGPGGQIPWDWSPDGRFLLFADGRKPGLWVYDRESGQTTPPADGEPHVRGVRFHPGGQWIAYTIHPVEYRSTAASHIWIRPFPGPGAPRQVGTERGYGPQWSAAGDELFYHGDTHIMAVPVQDQGDQLGTGQAVPLFEDRYVRHDTVGIGSFAVDPDGRFLMVRDGSGAPRPRIVIVQNFRTRLEELLPRRD
jgi:Tol biopolymer transport system component